MLKRAEICLHLGSVLTLLIGVFLFYLAFTDKEIVTSAAIILALVSVGLIFWYEITISGLKKFKPWAWKSAVIIFGTFIPNIFIIMGIIGMQSVLSNTMREQIFGKKDNKGQVNAKSFADIMSVEKHIKKDESMDDYIQNNDALRRYLNYNKDSNEAES